MRTPVGPQTLILRRMTLLAVHNAIPTAVSFSCASHHCHMCGKKSVPLMLM